jgi:hypothetical protein
MTTLLIIALIAGMLCIVAWKNPRYKYPGNTIAGTLERTPGFIAYWPLGEKQECETCKELKQAHAQRWRNWVQHKITPDKEPTNDDE